MRLFLECDIASGHSDLGQGDSDHDLGDGGESEAGDDQATAGVGAPDPSGPSWEEDPRREEC